MPNKFQPKESAIRRLAEADQWAVAQTALCTFVVNADGNRYVPYLNNDGKRFVINWNNLANDFNDNGRIAVSSNLR